MLQHHRQHQHHHDHDRDLKLVKIYSVQNRISECIYLIHVVLYHHQRYKYLQIRVTKFKVKVAIGESFMQIWVIKEVMHGDSRKVHLPVTPPHDHSLTFGWFIESWGNFIRRHDLQLYLSINIEDVVCG